MRKIDVSSTWDGKIVLSYYEVLVSRTEQVIVPFHYFSITSISSEIFYQLAPVWSIIYHRVRLCESQHLKTCYQSKDVWARE
jgi:hypothetical protein